jgi:DNA-binding IclR family transcriptional regulator
MLVATAKTDGTGKSLAQAAGLAIPTTHHLLTTLVAEGLLAKDANTRYVLGPKTSVLSEAVQRDTAAPSYLIGGLNRLIEETGETCYLALWRQGDIHLAAAMPGRHPVQVAVPSAPYRDAHARATGKLFLAYIRDDARDTYLETHPLRQLTQSTITSRDRLEAELHDIRRRGFATDHEEFQEGVSCAAAPVLADGMILAAYAMSVPKQRWSRSKADLIAAIVDTAASAAGASSGKGDGQESAA